jgi:AraC-like DNA-binding protein
MPNRYRYTLYVRNAIISIKQLLDDFPLKYKTSSDLLDDTTPVNRKILEKAFRDVFGYRIKEYQVRQRLEFSKNYLKEGTPVKRVADKCFYRSQSAYCTAFKREFKMTPTHWLKLEKINKNAIKPAENEPKMQNNGTK